MMTRYGSFRNLVAIALFPLLSQFAIAGDIQFNRDIRPIFSDTCFACHGPDSVSRKADLRLDQRDAAIASGAIVPGKPNESSIIQRLQSTDPETIMPPPNSHKVLTPEQKQKLVDWVAAGAEYQPHWSFIAPALPDLPEVRNKKWVRNPIDRFVLAKLEAKGLEPAPEADIRILVRRVCLDLTGLPPSPEEVEEVVMDPSEDRYEKYVDRLLQREQWGEHRGRFWLDYARYADTHGIHFDNFREMWAYRDWVIQAFNQNLPFDQFTIEQLAGDLLPNPTLDQRVATGFHRCNITTNEGGIIDEEYRVLYARDRTETTAQVWLGLSAGCAVCHDHKFDPITMHDFYSMSAFFNNTTQDARDGNRKDTPPTVPVPLREERVRFEQLGQEIKTVEVALQQQRDAAKPVFDAWLQNEKEVQQISLAAIPGLASQTAHLPLDDNSTSGLKVLLDGQIRRVATTAKGHWIAGATSDFAWVNTGDNFPTVPGIGDFERDKPFTISFWMRRPNSNVGGSLFAKMDDPQIYRGWDVWMEGDRIGMHLIHNWPDNALKFVSNVPVPADRWVHVAFTYDGSSKVAGFQLFLNGSQVGTNVQKDSLTETTHTDVPFRIGRRNQQSATPGVALQDIRLHQAKLNPTEISGLQSYTRTSYLVTKGGRTDEEKGELFDWYLNSKDQAYLQKSNQLVALRSERQQIESRGTTAHVMHERTEPAKAFVLFRGAYDQRRDEVVADTPKFLPPIAELPRNRLGLAQWLLRPENPLTARVTVNRFWQEVFGNGLVVSSGDFGITGQLPSHPELLDYLAVSFRENKWDMKAFFRQMVTSSTYRQSGMITGEKYAIDPENRCLSRGPRFRLDAEVMRDYVLACSGLLSKKLGGPSVRPYQPAGVWEAVAMPESNTRFYKEDEGESLYRRSMYTFWKRAAPPASMEILNAPNRETCAVRRERTNTPIQALVTLNDPQFVEAARMMAQRVLLELSGDKADEMARIQRLASYLLSRPLVPEELGIVQGSLHDLLATYKASPENAEPLLKVGKAPFNESLDKAELAAWTMLANELMNLDEILNK